MRKTLSRIFLIFTFFLIFNYYLYTRIHLFSRKEKIKHDAVLQENTFKESLSSLPTIQLKLQDSFFIKGPEHIGSKSVFSIFKIFGKILRENSN
jgi:hypothetical protein